MLEVKLEDQQFLISEILQSSLRRSIKRINTFCRKDSVRFVRMRRLKDLDMSLKTLDHCTGLSKFNSCIMTKSGLVEGQLIQKI